MPSMLEAGTLPVENMVPLAGREGWRPAPHMHKWFARRFATVSRALLVAAAVPENASFAEPFVSSADLWKGRTVLDPFCGAGTIVREARRLGATAIGVDVDPVACAVAAHEASLAPPTELGRALDRLKATVGQRIRPFHQVWVPEEGPCEVLHWFWVQVVECSGCGAVYEAHPSYVLAMDRAGGGRWVFCRVCHGIRRIGPGEERLACPACGTVTVVNAGTERLGRVTCPDCRQEAVLSKAAAGMPRWRIFAAEALLRRPPRRMPHRIFVPAGAAQADLYEAARARLAELEALGACVPDDAIPRTMADNRLRLYGYRRWRDLFNARQLLHLVLLSEEIGRLPEPERGFMALAFSNHLASNCMLAGYAAGWRRLSPLFSVRGWRHMVRPVELNPWLDGVGRGTFPNAVRQVEKAADRECRPVLPVSGGGFAPVPAGDGTVRIECADARSLAFLPTESVDLVLTDPPYLDNIDYSGLAEFYRPWMRRLGLVGEGGPVSASLATRDVEAFQAGLTEAFREAGRVLRPGGLLTFTFGHRRRKVWEAVAQALRAAGFRAIQAFPVPGNSPAGLHRRPRSLGWDIVVVCARADRRPAAPALENVSAAVSHAAGWAARLSKHGFGGPDQDAFATACRALAADAGQGRECVAKEGRPCRGV